MEEPKKKVLLLFPPKDFNSKDLDLKYELHTLPDEHFNIVYLEESFDIEGYIEKAVAYVKEQNIDGVFAKSCLGSLVQAIVAKRTGLLGPSFDSVFFCVHKYFGRTKQPKSDGFWFAPLDPRTPLEDIKKCIKSYPVCMKIVDGQYGIKMAVCQREEDLQNIIFSYSDPKLMSSNARKQEFYFKHIEDLSRFPGVKIPADIPMFMMESCVIDSSEHCFEFSLSQEGKLNPCELTDILLYEDKSIKSFVTPSQQLDKKEIVQKIESQFEEFLSFMKDIGLKSLFIDIEFLLRPNGQLQIVEINSRRSMLDCFQNGLLGMPELDIARQSAEISVGGNYLPTMEELCPGKIGWDLPIFVWNEGMVHDLLDVDYLKSIPNAIYSLFHDDYQTPITKAHLLYHSKQYLVAYVGLVTNTLDEGLKLVDQITAKSKKIP